MAKQRKRKPLTMAEQQFAEKNHNIIYDYLNKNKLDVEEYYDLAAIGYVEAVMNYHRRRKLQKYAFTTIAWHTMRTKVSNHIALIDRRKSLRCICFEDVHTEDDKKSLYDLIGADDEAFNIRLYISDIDKLLDAQSYILCKMLLQGSSDRECRKAMRCNDSELKLRKKILREIFTKYFESSCTGATLAGSTDQDEERAALTKENGSIKQIH